MSVMNNRGQEFRFNGLADAGEKLGGAVKDVRREPQTRKRRSPICGQCRIGRR
jgi:hypothetical protein